VVRGLHYSTSCNPSEFHNKYHVPALTPDVIDFHGSPQTSNEKRVRSCHRWNKGRFRITVAMPTSRSRSRARWRIHATYFVPLGPSWERPSSRSKATTRCLPVLSSWKLRGLRTQWNRRPHSTSASVDYLPITSIWKECGIIGARGPRIQAGALGGGPLAGGVPPAAWAGADGIGPYSAVIVRI